MSISRSSFARRAETTPGRRSSHESRTGGWKDACVAVVDGDYAAAADTVATVGSKRLQAELRLLAARSLAAVGRLAEAEAQLDLARAFFRKVGATAYLAEADEIVAAAS